VAELLAAYGTLMRDQTYEGRPDVDTLLRHVSACRIPGTLYSEGDYPWLVEGPGDVAGDLFEVEDPATLALLDAYENEGRHTDDGAGRYERRQVRLLEPDVDAWVYVWVGPRRGEPLDAADWRTFLALRGDR
jgi:gamma-glutamylcyclotransferase (GGCT)/AIG2-like uncharacterized protein YtfP